MQGVVIKYVDDKGFGFIKDENKENRFFHISNVISRKEFLENLNYYYYSEDCNNKCYIVEFNPEQNNKGLTVSNIKLTKLYLNDKSLNHKFQAIVTDFDYAVNSLTRIVQGIKKNAQIPYGVTAGSNGTYRIGFPEVTRELNIEFRKLSGIGWGTIEVRDLILELNDRQKITSSLVSKFKEKLIGKTIEVYAKKGQWYLKNVSILRE